MRVLHHRLPETGISLGQRKPRIPFQHRENSPTRKVTSKSAQTRSKSTPKPKQQPTTKNNTKGPAPVKMKLVKKSTDRFKLEQEIKEMEAKLKNETELHEQITQLKEQRDKLKSELEEKQNHSSAERENLEEYEFLRKRLTALRDTNDHLEDEVTKAMAINSILIERLGRILKESLKCSCDLLVERVSSLKPGECVEVVGDLKSLREERARMEERRREVEKRFDEIWKSRDEKLFNGIRVAALDSFVVYDQGRSELEELVARERELKQESKRLRNASEEAMSEYMIQDAKNELRNCQSDLLKVQYDIFNSRVYEVQLKFENEVMRIRREAAAKIKALKAKQEVSRGKYLGLLKVYNETLSHGKGIEEPKGMAELEAEFSGLDAEIQKNRASEAQAELEIEEKEFEGMQDCNEDIMKWISDQHLACLASQARYEALEKQITVLKENGGDKGMQELIAAETEESNHLNAVLVDSSNRLRALDVMMGGEDSDDVALDARFQSIQERIATILESDEPVSKLNAREQELRERLMRLKRNRK